MIKHKILYKDTKLFSKLISDYLDDNNKLTPFVNYFPSLGNFKKQTQQKKQENVNRNVLVQSLKKQNNFLSLSDKSNENIDLLNSENTFTVTTGHQLCLFTGPLYFIYKIISTINLSEKLNKEFPENNYVPIFWMASEDHDFQEINHINIFGKKIVWNSDQKGAVGKMKTDGINSLIEELKMIFNDDENDIINIFENSYLKHDNLSDATRFLINALFGKYGLVIIDGDDKKLKSEFISVMKKDIIEKSYFKTIRSTTTRLSENYKPQAFSREINFFKLSEGKRERITGVISEEEIENYPENFSPNVLMRSLYQEIILPNIAYVGGGAEVAYWMQLKDVFLQEKISFPILLLRNSVMWIDEKDIKRWLSFGFKYEEMFLDEHHLHKLFVENKYSFSLNKEKIEIEEIFKKIIEKNKDNGLSASIESELKKQINSISKLEKKILKSEKQKHETSLKQISKIKSKMFPNKTLQERFDNFIPQYFKHSETFIKTLKEELNPLDTNFLILSDKK